MRYGWTLESFEEHKSKKRKKKYLNSKTHADSNTHNRQLAILQWQLAIVLSYITLTDQPSSFKYWNLECNNLTIRMSVSRIKLARAFNEQWKLSKKIKQIGSIESFKHTHAKPKPINHID